MKDKIFDLDKLKNKYKGKKFSVLGDSISTLQGFNPKGYAVFYQGENSINTGVKKQEDTYWGELIETLGAELLKNDSWSGSLVSAPISQPQIFPSASSDERGQNLCDGDVKPDVIIVYMGINDYSSGVMIDGVRREAERYNYRYFYFAYDEMLKKLKRNYPECEIMCVTINTSYMKDNDKFSFPLEHMNTSLKSFNNAIKLSAQKNKCKFLNTFKYNIPYESIDTVHPTKAGMKTLCELMLKEINDIN